MTSRLPLPSPSFAVETAPDAIGASSLSRPPDLACQMNAAEQATMMACVAGGVLAGHLHGSERDGGEDDDTEPRWPSDKTPLMYD